MQAHYPFDFEREMGCTVDELRSWLPGASAGHALAWRATGADIALGEGTVTLDWEALTPRRIALITLPRLRVRFTATHVASTPWQQFMRHFDLYTLRGGG
jgi:hypothetical protein